MNNALGRAYPTEATGQASSGLNAQAPLVTVANAFDRANLVAMRVCQLADRLCGPVPHPVEDASLPKGPDSVFGALQRDGDMARRNLEDALMALDRIDAHLP